MAQRIENIPFAKLINTRDLGGLPAEGGKVIRPQTFLRAASLYQLVPSDGEKLVRDYKVAYDIDLRIDKEPSPASSTVITSCGKTSWRTSNANGARPSAR